MFLSAKFIQVYKKLKLSCVVKIYRSRLFFDKRNKILAEIYNLDNKKSFSRKWYTGENKNTELVWLELFFLWNCFSYRRYSIFDATFPLEIKKNAGLIPIFKKKDRMNFENYRPLSILPNLSKIYERFLYDRMYKHFNHNTALWGRKSDENVWTKGV